MTVAAPASTISAGYAEPSAWKMPTTSIAVRLFLTCWIVFVLHFATDIVREIYPALALGDHLSFRVDEYADMHPDLFEKEGYGWHIGNNPGASMLAAIPYALARPLIDLIVERVREDRTANGLSEPPGYDSPWPMGRDFYAEAWRRGFDIKFGLAAFVIQALCMAPISALGVVVMFFVLRQVFLSDRTALWLALLYGFGTPVFFRTGFLNHNMMIGHLTFMGFVVLWNPSDSDRWSSRARFLVAGLAGGGAVLLDYSGVVLLLGLFAYGLCKRRMGGGSARDVVEHGAVYVIGSLPPIALLWLYQWRSFGHALYPGQHWMPPVEWIELGYQGFGFPQVELFWALGFDYRFGLFATSPLLLLALAALFVDRGEHRRLPLLEATALLAICLALWVFFSGSNYTRLQFNTGVRYMAPTFPFLFVLAGVVLMRLPRPLLYLVAVLSVTQSWCLAMFREVELGLGVLQPVAEIFLGGPQLPTVTVMSRMQAYQRFVDPVLSPILLFLLVGAIIWGIWTVHPPPRAGDIGV